MSPEHSTYLEAVSTTQALTYSISRRHDLSLVFEPPVGSRALANALSLKYPFEGGLENQMKRAMLDFINSEPSIAKSAPAISGKSNLMLSSEGGTDLAHPPAQSLLVAATSGAKSGSGVWDVKTGQPVEKKRKKSRYEEAKRRKVAEVRKKKACDYHRKKKTEVWLSFGIRPPKADVPNSATAALTVLLQNYHRTVLQLKAIDLQAPVRRRCRRHRLQRASSPGPLAAPSVPPCQVYMIQTLYTQAIILLASQDQVEPIRRSGIQVFCNLKRPMLRFLTKFL